MRSTKYQAYIIRYWKELVPLGNANNTGRFILEVLATGERLGFTTKESLLEALDQKLEQDALHSTNQTG